MSDDMAATVSSLGPPSVGPGSAAKTVGFAVSATTRPGMYSNREPLSGNTLCHKVLKAKHTGSAVHTSG